MQTRVRWVQPRVCCVHLLGGLGLGKGTGCGQGQHALLGSDPLPLPRRHLCVGAVPFHLPQLAAAPTCCDNMPNLSSLAGDALYAFELALSLEKLNFQKLRQLHDVADKHGDAQMADFIGGSRVQLTV